MILDEVGRGTSTYDGLALAWAITEHLATRLKCRTLFATHYHELTELAELFDNVRNFNVAVREWMDEVVFLHRIVPGGTDKSYGIHVAKLAGIPKSILTRSQRNPRRARIGLRQRSHRRPPRPQQDERIRPRHPLRPKAQVRPGQTRLDRREPPHAPGSHEPPEPDQERDRRGLIF